MKLKSVRVRNFKCVDDSTEFEVCPVTCLVGKNEAGKTSLLEALYKLNPDVEELGEFDVLSEYPRRRLKEYQRRADAEPDDALTTTWELDDKDVEELTATFGPDAVQSRTVTISEGYYKNRKCDANVEALLPRFVYFSKFLVMNGRVSVNDIIEKQRKGGLSGSDRVFLALLDLAGTTPEKLRDAQTSEELIVELEAASTPITDKIFHYWSQNSNLRVSFNVHPARANDPAPFNKGLIFETRILNVRHNLTLNFDERSTGFVWFFSFLVWFSQMRRNYGQNLIVLLDDPGFGLHAKAQEDLRRYISEELAPHYQVIYTTHSPFMLDVDKLHWARTVEDVIVRSDGGREKYLGTKVGDRVLSRDPDTLVPLQAALGYEISQTLSTKKKILFVEKLSDLLYLRWFSKRLAERGQAALDSTWMIVPCGEVNKIRALTSLLAGGSPDIAVLLNGLPAQDSNVLDPRNSELLADCRVFTVDTYADTHGGSVEDLIGREAYFTLVNMCYKLPRKHRLRTIQATSLNGSVITEVEQHFGMIPSTIPELDPHAPAEYLTENGKKLQRKLGDLEEAFQRFEALFRDLNSRSRR
ncbi:MAG: AAA family ATPase [Sedimentisphaerales bacterium]|jgi:hypothetical protein